MYLPDLLEDPRPLPVDVDGDLLLGSALDVVEGEASQEAVGGHDEEQENVGEPFFGVFRYPTVEPEWGLLADAQTGFGRVHREITETCKRDSKI